MRPLAVSVLELTRLYKIVYKKYVQKNHCHHFVHRISPAYLGSNLYDKISWKCKNA